LSILFKGKNIERLNHDVFVAMEHNIKRLRKIKLNRETEAKIDMIRQKLKDGECSVEECRRQFRLVMRQYKWQLKIIQAWSLTERLNQINSKNENSFLPRQPRRFGLVP